jgi:hypothetical protein
MRFSVVASCALLGACFAVPSWAQPLDDAAAQLEQRQDWNRQRTSAELEARQAQQRFVEQRRLARERDSLQIQRRELARRQEQLENRARQEQLLRRIQRQASEDERLAEERQAALQARQRAARRQALQRAHSDKPRVDQETARK